MAWSLRLYEVDWQTVSLFKLMCGRCFKTCCARRGHTREHSWSATAATTCGRMGTAFFRTGTCISRLDNFDHVRTKRVWNWHDCFLWQNSGQVRYVQMWCPQFCSIEEKGLCPLMVLPELCNLEASHEKEVVGSWLIRRTWVRPSSPTVCQTLNGGAFEIIFNAA